MSRDALRWGALATAGVGAAIGELVSYNAGIALTFVAIVASFRATNMLNVVASRLVFVTALALHGILIWRASGNPLLGVGPPLAGLLIMPSETTTRRLGYQNLWLVPVALGMEIGFALVARPYSLWHLALVPTLLGSVAFTGKVVTGLIDFGRRCRAVTAKVGDPFPDFVLPARSGRPEFRLSDHRGRYVLVCLLRGDWCPVCHLMMRIIAKDAPILAAHGVMIVAVSADAGANADDLARVLGVDYSLLVDPGCTVAAALGAVHADEPEPGKSTNLPAMFLVDPEGRLAFLSIASDITLHDPRRVLRMVAASAPSVATA